MGEYLPFAESHSIQEAQVSLHFQRGFEEREIALARARAEADLKGTLPRSAEIRGGSVTVDVSDLEAGVRAGAVSASLAGFQFSRVRGDGRPAQSLELSDNLVSVNLLDYEGWGKVLSDSIRYIGSVLEPLSLEGNPVLATSLRFVDRYTFNGETREARADLLFVKDNEFISRRCFTVGPLWHCHTGWFDSFDPTGRVLNHLNVGSSVVDGAPTVNIDHRGTFQLSTPRQSLDALLGTPREHLSLEGALNCLHNGNKDILRAILVPDMLAKIGM